MSRFLSRRSNGRFRRATLENTFGLSVAVCPACSTLANFRRVGEPPPTVCVKCGADLAPKEKTDAET